MHPSACRGLTVRLGWAKFRSKGAGVRIQRMLTCRHAFDVTTALPRGAPRLGAVALRADFAAEQVRFRLALRVRRPYRRRVDDAREGLRSGDEQQPQQERHCLLEQSRFDLGRSEVSGDLSRS